MDKVSEETRAESIRSLRSAIGKSKKALAQMTAKGSNTTLVERRLKALQIGLAVLETTWAHNSRRFAQEELAEARRILIGLFPSIEGIYAKLKMGSPQRTLLERRMAALRLAVQGIDDLISS